MSEGRRRNRGGSSGRAPGSRRCQAAASSAADHRVARVRGGKLPPAQSSRPRPTLADHPTLEPDRVVRMCGDHGVVATARAAWRTALGPFDPCEQMSRCFPSGNPLGWKRNQSLPAHSARCEDRDASHRQAPRVEVNHRLVRMPARRRCGARRPGRPRSRRSRWPAGRRGCSGGPTCGGCRRALRRSLRPPCSAPVGPRAGAARRRHRRWRRRRPGRARGAAARGERAADPQRRRRGKPLLDRRARARRRAGR